MNVSTFPKEISGYRLVGKRQSIRRPMKRWRENSRPEQTSRPNTNVGASHSATSATQSALKMAPTLERKNKKTATEQAGVEVTAAL
jgi:hypothetical protein